VPAGEVAYAAGRVVVTRQLMWRQSRQAMIRVETRRALFVSELLPGDGDLAAPVESDLADGLRELFGAVVFSTVLDRERPSSPTG
jgi:DNA/RNA-binding domain of Phe-tRNA-synthetase-like protein